MSLESGYTARLIVYRPGGRIELDFEKWTGGDLDSDETKHRSAQTRQETARGGLAKRNNVTLSRECDAAAWALIGDLEKSAGIDDCLAIRQMVGPRGEAIGRPLVIGGKLKSPKYPDFDLASTNVGMLEVEISASQRRG